jgi:hypothetical protein
VVSHAATGIATNSQFLTAISVWKVLVSRIAAHWPPQKFHSDNRVGQGNQLYAPGTAQPKNPSEHKIVGQPIKREDVAPKVFCQEDFCTDIKAPGMVHGRMIRPAVAGAVPVKVDDTSIKGIPNAKVVWDKGFLGVVADTEWGRGRCGSDRVSLAPYQRAARRRRHHGGC